MFQKFATSVGIAMVVAACSGGPGPAIVQGPSTDQAAMGPEGTTSGVDPGECIPCSGAYQCVGTLEGETINDTEALFSSSASCPASQNNTGISLACGGTIVSGVNAVGTWKDIGAGVIVACLGSVGADECITCTPGGVLHATGGNQDAGGGAKPTQFDGG